MKTNPEQPVGADTFHVPPAGATSLLCEMAAGPAGCYQIALFEARGHDTLQWTVRKRILFPVEKDPRGVTPGWTSEMHLSEIDLNAMGKLMLGRVIGRVSGESMAVVSARDQVLTELRTKFKNYLEQVGETPDAEALDGFLTQLKEGDQDEYEACLWGIRLMAAFTVSWLKETEVE